MKRTKTAACAALGILGLSLAARLPADDKKTEKTEKPAAAALAFQAKDIDGKEVDLTAFKGKVLLVVNVASL